MAHHHKNTYRIANEKGLTTTADHVVIIWIVNWPAVVFCVVQIMPATHSLKARQEGFMHNSFLICVKNVNMYKAECVFVELIMYINVHELTRAKMKTATASW